MSGDKNSLKATPVFRLFCFVLGNKVPLEAGDLFVVFWVVFARAAVTAVMNLNNRHLLSFCARG